MIKCIDVSDLKVGMFVHDLNCDWASHPFFRKSFLLKQDSEIAKIVEAGIHEVYIDTQKGLDVRHARTEQEVKETLQQEMAGNCQQRTLAHHPGVVCRRDGPCRPHQDPGADAGKNRDAGRAPGQGGGAGAGGPDDRVHYRIGAAQWRRTDHACCASRTRTTTPFCTRSASAR